ncbi:MAG: hypothetical protein SGJ09_12045 [Phycisphaerae bacterium]|nr:hypothetical protein [Phycisphaerae bacterium]
MPLLRKLEQATRTSTVREGTAGLRSELHLALRRLGEMPEVGPCMPLVPCAKCESGGWAPDQAHAITKPVAFSERARNAEKVREGMSIVELGALIGGPDAQFYDADLREHCLDWDLDGPSPSTLRIALDLDTNIVKAVVRITPAVWRAGYERELGRRALPPN